MNARRFSALAATLIGAGLASFGLFLGPPAPTARAQLQDSSTKVDVSAVAAQDTVAPGGQVPVAVIFDMAEGWHTHTNDPQVPPELGDASFYYKTEIKPQPVADNAATLCTDLIQWPEAITYNVAFIGEPVPYDVFSGQAVAYVPVTVATNAPEGRVPLRFLVTYQACDDTTCLAPVIDQPVATEVVVAAASQTSGPANAALFADFDPGVWVQACGAAYAADIRAAADGVDVDAFGLLNWRLNPSGALGFLLLLLVAALGGLLLNFTPCVLPVIPIKIMSMSQAATSWRRSFALGLAMSLGVVAFWVLLGGLIAGVAGFTAANQLFQYPLFTLGVGVFIAVMAVGMTGMFSLTLPQSVYKYNPGKDTLGGSFLFGILAAVLSTPCTAPFMGAAAAWAATQAPALTLMTFAAIGVGMAAPYMVLSAFPRLVRKMPRTGPASELIKQVMGLLMLAAAAYFVGVGLSGLLTRPPEPPSRLYWWAVAAFVAAAGLWLAWRTVKISPKAVTRALFMSLGAFMAVGSVYLASSFVQQGPIPWQYYTPERFEAAKAGGKTVVVEFTAEWCLNCKTLEETVLKDPRVVALLNEANVVPMKVDLTGNNPDGNAMLKAVDRVTIPLLVVFAPDGSEVYKADYYTVDQVVAAVEEARAVAARAVGSGG